MATERKWGRGQWSDQRNYGQNTAHDKRNAEELAKNTTTYAHSCAREMSAVRDVVRAFVTRSLANRAVMVNMDRGHKEQGHEY